MPDPQSPLDADEKRSTLAGAARSVFSWLRLFWVTGLALLIVAGLGLYSGWSTPRQWSDALFFAAVAQVVVAAVPLLNFSGVVTAAANVRYIAKGNVGETSRQIVEDALRKSSFSLRAFLGAVLTVLLALLVLWV
jgi:hypothetical protein